MPPSAWGRTWGLREPLSNAQDTQTSLASGYWLSLTYHADTFFAYAELLFKGTVVLLVLWLLHPPPLGQVFSTAGHRMPVHCICLNSPTPQTMCEWVGALYLVEAAQDATWLTLIRRSNLDSPYYIDICIFSLSFCCNGLLRSLVQE